VHAFIVEEALKRHKPLQIHMLRKGSFHQSQVQGVLFSFFLKEDTLPQMHQISLEIIIDTYKSVEFIAIYGCFDKPTL
jgi:hypothetical protein